jgi:2'-5' RNA ligase
MRLFIAIPLPDEVRDRVAAVQERLKKVPADVAWVRSEKFHLTLKFLGEVPDEKVAPVADVLSAAVRKFAPFAASLHGLGAFPAMCSPRVVWVGIRDGRQPLAELAEAVDGALQAVGFVREQRPYSAHLTLGRVRSSGNLDALVKRLALLKDLPFGDFTVDHIDIIRSIMHPQGSEYQSLAPGILRLCRRSD